MPSSFGPFGRSAGIVSLVLLLAISALVPTVGGSATAVREGPVRVAVTATSDPLPSRDGTVVVADRPAIPAGAVALGALPSATPVAVAVGLSSHDPSGLSAFVDAESTPGTAEYRHPLSPTLADERYGASAASIGAAERYFAGFGLTARANPDGLLVYASGSSAEVARAFSTSLELYRLADGRLAFAATSAATLPDVAPWSGVYGLSNATPIRPGAAPGPTAETGTPAAGCGGIDGSLAPCEIETAYNFSSLLSSGDNGTGERIAVVDAYSGSEPQTRLESDLATFASAAGVRVGDVHYLYPVPSSGSLNASSTNPGWGLEEALDLEWTRAIAPGATIDMTFSPNPGAGLYAAIDWLVARGAVNVISLSWGEPDVGIYGGASSGCTAGCNATTDGSYAVLGPVLELAAAEGISVFAASGDCGAADGTDGVATNFPASDPYVTGVGGTVLTVGTGGIYDSETAWAGNESGTDGGCSNDGGSGGGYAPTPRPWWQTGLPAGTTGRGVPDVAMDARTPVDVEYNGGPAGVIGTSVATPIWAGIGAIADQHAAADLGLLDPSLYRILGSSRYASDFHDITSGSNGYKARVGWDPVTGIGSPIVDQLVDDLASGGGLPLNGLSTALTASPTSGAAPLTVDFALSASGGTEPYPFEGVSFGDANASFAVDGRTSYTYSAPGVYLAQSYVADANGNESVSAPVVIVVGGGSSLAVTLSASAAATAIGESVTFSAVVTGGTGPFTYDFWFGDGGSENGTNASVGYAYPVAGAFCAVVAVTDSADPADGGLGGPVAVDVNGASGTACGAGAAPLTVTPARSLGPKDAPADLPDLFTVSGGATGSGEPAPTETYTSTDPYVVACQCTVFPTAGNYSVGVTVVDADGDRANASANVTIAPPLDAVFTASALAGPAPLAVTFRATASGGYRANAADTVWTIGPSGTERSGAEVNYSFADPGEYLATALLTDAGNGTASETFLVDVTSSTGPPSPGLAGTIGPSRALRLGTTVTFSASAVAAPTGSAVFWALGGSAGAASGTANETYFAAPPDDELSAAVELMGANFTPILTVPVDLTDFVDEPTAGFSPSADDLSLATVVGPQLGVPPLAVSGSASADGPGGVTVAWSFGSASGGTGATAAHDFSAAGNFTVVARATDPFGDVAYASARIEVVRPLAVVASVTPSAGDAPLTIQYRAAPTGGVGGPYNVSWTFAGRAGSTDASGAVRFATPGTYAVRLVVTDRAGESIERNWTVSVRLPEILIVGVIAVGVGTGAILAILLGRSGRRRTGGPADD